MNLEITEKNELPLLSRTEVSGKLAFENKTPSNDEVKKEIASKMKSDEALVVMKRILTHYGEQTGEFEAYVYKDQKSLERVEPKKKEKKEGEAAEGAKKEEAPKEDKKEEKSAEAKEEKKEDKKEPSKPSEPAEPSKPAGD